MELDVGHAVHLPAGGGDVIRDVPESRVEILSDRDELHATWTRFEPFRDGASPHVHRQHNDLFYVLAGELMVLAGPDQVETPQRAGTIVLAPPLVVHGFRNAAEEELRYLNFHAPGGGFAAYMRGEQPGFDSEDPPADGGRAVTDAYIGTGEVLADRPGLRVSLLVDVEEIGIAEVATEPGGSVTPPLHVHRRHSESFYVLAGELTFTVNGSEAHASTGSWVQVPPGVPHTFAATGFEDVRYLNIHTPGCGFGNFVRALNAALGEDELAPAQARFDQEPA
jgi:mannose-6-phosphate isomerase-like protein (cupin superfamily)